MQLATVADMKEMDKKTILKSSSIRLMESAAKRVYEVIQKRFLHHQKLLIVCGSGNNGGDGYALACYAYQNYDVHIFQAEYPKSEDALHFYKKAKKVHIPILQQLPDVDTYDVVIDALFGTGLNREIIKQKEIINIINSASATVLSIDIPSGIHGDSGQVLGCAIHADIVVTFQFAKRGLYFYPGYMYADEIIVADIGIALMDQVLQQPIELIDAAIAHRFLPKRENHSHKGTYGKVLMIGGSVAMHGAITMAAYSALHSGLGTLTLMIPESIYPILANKLLEAMLLIAEQEDGYFGKGSVSLLQANLKKYDMIMIGCGLGRKETSEQLVHEVLLSDKPCVIDADALYLLGKDMSYLKRDAQTILTPHIKEFSYLCHKSIQEIQEHPIDIATAFLAEYPNVTLVLKDERTLIFHKQQIYMNIAGSHALAKGGSGDVLCGLITGLFAQSKEPLHASVCGVYLHALSAEILMRKHSAYTILPHHLYPAFDDAFQFLEQSSNKND